MVDKIYVGQKCQTFKNLGEYPPVSRVTLVIDEEHYFTAGDDTGYHMELQYPWADQKTTDKLYEQLKGFIYRPFEATGVDIDPAYEPGDAITIGGIYSFIGQDTRHFGAMGLCDISCPSTGEMEEEFPYVDPVQRELKRRVKLGQAYFGAKISRREGLVIEKIEQEIIKAKVILNAEKFAFYGPNNEEQLYFDPAAGCFKFCGALNVNDKFIVDKLGNAKIAGSLNLATGDIYWGDTPPNKKRYATSTSGPWHDTMSSGDIYCCDWDYNAKEWKEPYKFKGQDGTNGSDASVTRSNVERALAYAKSLGSSFMAVDSVGSPIIYGGKIYGSEIYAGGVVGSGGVVGTGSVISLTDDGIEMRNDLNGTYLQITSKDIQGVGTVTALFGGSSPLILDAQSVMIGQNIGKPSAIGIEVTPQGINFYGPVHFHGETTGATFVFA